jgi:hypothetical protein
MVTAVVGLSLPLSWWQRRAERGRSHAACSHTIRITHNIRK